jgi:aryl-alcohol dehydrogenase-like predicted oxidoreductase
LLKRLAARIGATPAQVALAWLLARKPWIVPIPGTTRLNRLEENIQAASIDLDAADRAEIEQAAESVTIEGARYPASTQAMINR